MTKRITSIILSVILVFMVYSNVTHAVQRGINPSRESIEKKIEEIAHKRGIPSVILKSIARVESIYQQYKPDGSVFRGSSGEIGLMQIYNKYGYYDSNRLKYDIWYNIEISAEILLQKWANYGQVGNMDPNILENWYFALWAYNGWSSLNNPNAGKKVNTYQELIYKVAKDEYGQDITSIDTNLLPNSGKPSKNIHVPTPEKTHMGDIPVYMEGDLVAVDSSKPLTLRSNPSSTIIDYLENGTTLEVIEGPVLKDSFLWYKLRKVDDGLEGWTVCNWIDKIGSKYPFEDIGGLLERDYIIKLHDKEIIKGHGNGQFNPYDNINRQEISVLLANALNLESLDYTLPYDDASFISDWAVDSVKAVSEAGFMVYNEDDNMFNPYNNLTREEAAFIAAKVLDNYLVKDTQLENDSDEEVTVEDIAEIPEDENHNEETVKEKKHNIPIEQMIEEYVGFKDAYNVSSWAYESVKIVREEGIMEGVEGMFSPKEYVKRAEISKILVKLLDRIDWQESTY